MGVLSQLPWGMADYQFHIQTEPQYVPEQSDPLRDEFGFAYTITITNTGAVAAQLISRHWVIQNAHGQSEEVRGLGVVGHQPLLQPGESFQYTSGCRLKTASGSMHGEFFFVAVDGHRFECAVAPFMLDASAMPGASHLLH
jgi:ApaG protein